jgi:hypothetical protein
MHVVQMLYEMIPPVECSLGFWFVPALLVLVSGHVSIVRVHLTTERAGLKESGLCVAANPCCS